MKLFITVATFSLINYQQDVTCSHSAAIRFYINSIEHDECNYLAYKCENKMAEYENSFFKSCPPRGCNKMGHYASDKNELGNLCFYTEDDIVNPSCYNTASRVSISTVLVFTIAAKLYFY